MRRCLKLSSIAVLLMLCACSRDPYQAMKRSEAASSHMLQSQYNFDKVVYRCHIDGKVALKSFHLSGVLFIKKTEPRSYRILFQNEMGYSFFDLEYKKNNEFIVHSVIDKMNNAALLKTLRKDFALLLNKELLTPESPLIKNHEEFIVHKTYQGANNYFFYKNKNSNWYKAENWGERSKVVTLTQSHANVEELGDNIIIKHYKANFTIQLNKLDSNAEE